MPNTYTQDPETGDLNDTRTEHTPAMEYKASEVEHTLIFTRPSGDSVGLCCQHFNGRNQLHICIMGDLDAMEVKSEIELSYQEAKLLRALLNRREVSLILDQQ
jgi:hypothetical protein